MWISFAQFEQSIAEDRNHEGVRQVFQEGNEALKEAQAKEERLMLLETWQAFEVCTVFCF